MRAEYAQVIYVPAQFTAQGSQRTFDPCLDRG
jgi:hypothetical protein